MEDLVYFLKQSQTELKIRLYYLLNELDMKPVYGDGFVYSKGDIPVLLVAHMDTVAPEPPKRVFYHESLGTIFNPDGILGGDDRCGVYAIIKLLEKHRPHVLFTEDEEIGLVGAFKAVIKVPKPDIKYIIEIDRRGNNDCVFYECGNTQFMDYVQKFEFKKNFGSCSDISVLGRVWDIAAVNLSSGYYNEHTEREYVVFSELQETIRRTDNMLKDINNAPYFDYKDISGEYDDFKVYTLKRNRKGESEK